MVKYLRDELHQVTNRELRERGEEPLDETEFAFVLAEWERDPVGEPADGEGLSELAVDLRALRTRLEEYGLVPEKRTARVSEVAAPPWWRLYCHRVSEPYMPLRAEMLERLRLDAPLTVEYLGVYIRTEFASSQIHAQTIPKNDYAFLRFPIVADPAGRVGVMRIARLAVPEDDAGMLAATVALNKRREQVGKEPVSLPSLGTPTTSPYWWLWWHAANIARDTGATEEAAVAFLVCDQPLHLPWLEVRTVERGRGVDFELSVGSPAVSADAVASAYAAAVAESGQEAPEGSAIEAPAVELVIAYEEALRRFPKGRGPSNKGVKEKRVASLPEHVRAHFGQDADTVDKMYHRKVKMLPDDLKARGGDKQ